MKAQGMATLLKYLACPLGGVDEEEAVRQAVIRDVQNLVQLFQEGFPWLRTDTTQSVTAMVEMNILCSVPLLTGSVRGFCFTR